MTEIIIKTWPNGQTSLALAALRFCLGDDPALRLSHPSPTTPSPAGGSDLGLSPGQVPGQRYLVEYAPFAQTAVARFEQALAQGTVTDDAAGFARFASEDFTPYTAFLNHWVRSDFVRDQIVLNLADLYDNPVAWLQWVLGMLTPDQPPRPDQLDRITRAAPGWVAAHPPPDLTTFRHYDATLFDQLGRFTLRRDVVQQIFKEMLGRPPKDEAILSFQCLETHAAMRSEIQSSAKYQEREAQTADTNFENTEITTKTLSPHEIKTGYMLLLGRQPSSEEIQRMEKRVTDLNSMRKIILGSAEFAGKYAQQFKPNLTKSAAQPTFENKGESLVSSPATLLPRDSERIIFLHIPKCGGTTLHNVLELWYGKNKIHAERFNGLYNQDIMGLGSKQVFSGHFDFYSTSFIPDPKLIISVLRDPIDRLVSLYNFHRAHGNTIIEQNNIQHARWANDHDIDSYFANPIITKHHSLDNSMVRHFSNIPQIGNGILVPAMGSVGLDEMLEQAIENLSKFAFIGFMDQYESDVGRLAHVLGMTPPQELQRRQVLEDLMETNTAMKRIVKQRPSPASLEAIEELTAYDRILYTHARALFAS